MPDTAMPALDVMRADVIRTATERIARWLDRRVQRMDVLLETLAAGKTDFRNAFFRDLRGLPVSDDMCEKAWVFLWRVWETRVQPQTGAARPADVLDDLEVQEKRPPTPREIAEGWQVESASSDEGRRHLYGPDGSPQALLDQLRRVPDEGA